MQRGRYPFRPSFHKSRVANRFCSPEAWYKLETPPPNLISFSWVIDKKNKKEDQNLFCFVEQGTFPTVRAVFPASGKPLYSSSFVFLNQQQSKSFLSLSLRFNWKLNTLFFTIKAFHSFILELLTSFNFDHNLFCFLL